MADDFRADLDQLRAQASQRPRLRRLAQRQRPHEVTEIVGQDVERRLYPDPARLRWYTSARGRHITLAAATRYA